MTSVDRQTDAVLARSTAWYGASNILQRAIPVLLLPLMTVYLTPADFGLVAIFTSIVGIATPFVGLNTPYAVRRQYFETEQVDFPTYVANCLGLVALGSLGACLVAGAFGDAIGALTNLPTGWLFVAVGIAGGQVVINVLLTIWQVQHRAGSYTALQVGRAACTGGLTLWLIIELNLAWRGVLAAMLASTMLSVAVVCAPALRHWVKLRYSREYVRHALRYGGGLIPHTLGMLAITSMDRFFINHFVGASETGLYWIGYQFGLAVALAADAFNRAWSPWLYASLKSDDAGLDRRVVKVCYLAFAAFAIVALLVTAAAPYVLHYFVAAGFQASERFVWWIAVGFAFNGMYRLVAGFIFYNQKTSVLSWITGLSAAVNFALNFVLVPRYGAIGAAQATAVAFGLSFALTWLAANRLHPMPWTLGGRARARG